MCRLLRSFAAFTCLLLVGGFGLVLEATPASATSTILCRGYDGCARAGMSNAGYKTANGTMYWRMYSGHNCTNYAAYRMVRSGLPNVRPWTGGGNASNWGHANKAITDGVPTVGAVAWWDAYVRPAGSAGHVAYVERVISADEIVVSQDSWGGDFSWARITRTGGSWPSGFVHFNDATLTRTGRPTLSGTAKVGALLTASPGSWSPADPTFQYQWRADGVVVPNATGPTLRLTAAMLDKRIRVWVTASKVGFRTATATSALSAVVQPAVIKNTVAPSVSGTPKVDSTLLASSGTWVPAPTSVAYQWNADGEPIAGATAATLTPDAGLVGKALTVTVTASKAGYTDVPVTSAPTAAVAPGTFKVTAPPSLRYPTPVEGAVRPGQTLTIDPPRASPADGVVAVQWLRGGVPVDGSTGTTYAVTAGDLGSRISATVTVTKPGYTTLSYTVGPTWVVKTPTSLAVDATSPRRGQVRLVVRATAADVPVVQGVVQVRYRGRLLQELTLQGGAAGVRLTGLPSGSRTITVSYRNTRTTMHALVRRALVVK